MAAKRISDMSTLIGSTDTRAPMRSEPSSASAEGHGRTRRRVALPVSIVVLGWSSVEFVNLSLNHTTGPELYGVLVGAVAVVTGILSTALLTSKRRRLLASTALLVVWVVVALGGVAGTVAHIIGPVEGHGPVDLRPRPVAAPLIFTALGLIGAAALFYGQRLSAALRDQR